MHMQYFHLLIINYLDDHVFYTTFMFKYNYYLVYSDLVYSDSDILNIFSRKWIYLTI